MSDGVEIIPIAFDGVEVVLGEKYSIKIIGGENFQFYTGTFLDAYLKGTLTDAYGNYENAGDLYFRTFVNEGPITSTAPSLVSNNSLSVYPNPAAGGVVKFASFLNNVEVHNVYGALVLKVAQTNELDVLSLDPGVYTIKTNQGATKLLIQ